MTDRCWESRLMYVYFILLFCVCKNSTTQNNAWLLTGKTKPVKKLILPKAASKRVIPGYRWEEKSLPQGVASQVWSRILVVVQFLSHVQFFATPWTAAHQTLLSFTISQLAQIHVHSISDTIWPSHSLMLPSPLAFNLSQHQALF